MAKSNTTAYIILGLLDHEELSGYDIKKRIDSMIRYFWEVGYGQIYPTLKTLESEGLITKKSAESSKGPEKYLYSITGAGRVVLKEWLEIPETKEYTRYEILLKLFFSSRISAEENISRINAFREQHQRNLEMITFFEKNLENVMAENTDHLYYYLTVLFGEQVYKAYISWAEQAVNLIEEFKIKQPDNPENPL